MSRFIQVLQKDIVTKPEQWKDAEPGKYIKLSNKAKNVYSVLSVIAFSAAGNAKGKIARNVGKLGEGWFWTSHSILQQLTGNCQKTVQRGIKELKEAGFIDYHPARKNGHKCFFKIKRIQYNFQQEDTPRSRVKPKPVKEIEPTLPVDADNGQRKNRIWSPKSTPVEEQVPTLPGESDIPQKELKEIEKKPVKLEIPYREGVLFQSGKDTHNDEGQLMDKNGKWILDFDFISAETKLEEEGEEACLEYVSKKNIENHLVPEYREKLAKLKN